MKFPVMSGSWRKVSFSALMVCGAFALCTGCRSSGKKAEPELLGPRTVVPPPYAAPAPVVAAPAEPVPLPAPAEIAPVTPELPAVTLPPAVESKPITYTVQKGDSLWRIATSYGVSYQELAEFNHINPDSVLKVGTNLRIPPGGKFVPADQRPKYKPEARKSTKASPTHAKKSAAVKPKAAPARDVKTEKKVGEPLPADGKYTVKSGDSLWLIAHRFQLHSEDIRKANNLTTDRLDVGQVLVLTAAAPAAGESAPAAAATESAAPAAAEGTAVVTEGAPPVALPAPAPAVTPEAPSATAAKAPAPATLDFPKTLDHTVSEGETLEVIAEMYDTKVDEIKAANPGVKSNADLKPNLKIVVPYH